MRRAAAPTYRASYRTVIAWQHVLVSVFLVILLITAPGRRRHMLGGRGGGRFRRNGQRWALSTTTIVHPGKPGAKLAPSLPGLMDLACCQR